jgi:hypothetical protein
MQVPRYWRMKKHLYQLNGYETHTEVETEVERVQPKKEVVTVQAVATLDHKQKLPVVA